MEIQEESSERRYSAILRYPSLSPSPNPQLRRSSSAQSLSRSRRTAEKDKRNGPFQNNKKRRQPLGGCRLFLRVEKIFRPRQNRRAFTGRALLGKRADFYVSKLGGSRSVKALQSDFTPGRNFGLLVLGEPRRNIDAVGALFVVRPLRKVDF